MRVLFGYLASVFFVVGCASQTSTYWDAQSWAMQTARDVSSSRWGFSATPLGGDGFKLKLTLKTQGGLVLPAGADAIPSPADIEEAAKSATPTGCTYVGYSLAEDRSIIANYDCTRTQQN